MIVCFRPGASCGLLLGAVTMTAVILSKMVVLSRGMAFGEVKFEGISFFHKRV